MTEKKRGAGEAAVPGNFVEKRREERYEVPRGYHRDISLQIRVGDERIPAVLANFSRSGILFETLVPLEPGTETECAITLSFMVSRKIAFPVTVKYCYRNNGSHIIGASINTAGNDPWFDVFVEICDFIVTRRNRA